MQHRVRSKLRGLAWTVFVVVLSTGCSFDVSAIPPQRELRPGPVTRHDSGAAAAPEAGRSGGATLDAGGSTLPPDQPSTQPPPPPPTTEANDAQIIEPPPPDPPFDAAIDAAVDARIEPEEDASMPEPEPTECDPDLPCVCPHLAAQEVAGGPCTCAVAACAPDDHCRLLARQSTRYYFCDDERTWQQARDRCESVPDLHLAAVESAAEDAFLLANVSDKTWLGGSDGEQEGYWRWPDRRPFYDEDSGEIANAYVNWHSSEPNNDGLSDSPADCLLLWYENSVWADASCSDQHGYVCEVDP